LRLSLNLALVLFRSSMLFGALLGRFRPLGLRFSLVAVLTSGFVSMASSVFGVFSVLSFGLVRSWSSYGSLFFGLVVSVFRLVTASVGDIGALALSWLVTIGVSMGLSAHGFMVVMVFVSLVLAVGLLVWAALFVASAGLMLLSIYDGDLVEGFGSDFPLSLAGMRRVWTRYGRVLLVAGWDAAGAARVWVASHVVARVIISETISEVAVAIVGGLRTSHLAYVFARVGMGEGSWFAMQHPASRVMEDKVLVGVDRAAGRDERSFAIGDLWRNVPTGRLASWSQHTVGTPSLFVYSLVFYGNNVDSGGHRHKDVVAICLASPRPLAAAVLDRALEAALGGTSAKSHGARLAALREALKAV
jgi:hypothetical protein